MHLSHSFLQTNFPPERPPFVWVLAPSLQTDDPNLDYYYDFSQSIEEYTRVFETLHLQWQWQPVTLQNYTDIIAGIAAGSTVQTPLILNLCDGDEVNGTPGIGVIYCLQEHQLIYTGAEPAFYANTTSKIEMKELFDATGVAHAAWKPVRSKEDQLDGICEEVGVPLIVKPAVSGGSMGLGTRNVVHTPAELQELVQELFRGYRGWDFSFGGLVAEQFISGPEYTVFISGSYQQPHQAIIYTPVERVFHKDLPDTQKFLSFDRLWETYEAEQPVNETDDFYQYQLPPAHLHAAIKELSWQAYCAVAGTGYGRVDLRMDQATETLYVLEVNAQCGLSEDENFTSIGSIARLGQHSYAGMIAHILQDALQRHYQPEHQNLSTS